MQISGKKVLLTGATGGIGQAFAAMLDQQGASLILAGRNQAALEKLNAELGGRHTLVVADITTTKGCAAIADHCRRQGVDIVVNNAGISEFVMLDEQDPEEIRLMLHTNLLAPVLLTQAVLPLLQKRQEALVVNVGSTFGSIGYPGFAAYSATKFGLRGFTEALRRELANTAVRVCYLSPRATRTGMNSDAVNKMNQALGNTMDSPEVVADSLKTLITGDKSTLYLGWPEKLFVRINSLFPSLVDGAIGKQLSAIIAFARRTFG